MSDLAKDLRELAEVRATRIRAHPYQLTEWMAAVRIEALEARNREHEERYMDKEAVSPESLSAEERLIWLLGDLMNAAENYFGAENPKRLGHIDCAAARIIDEIIAPIQADLADAIAENTNLHAEIVKLRLARALVAKGGGDE